MIKVLEREEDTRTILKRMEKGSETSQKLCFEGMIKTNRKLEESRSRKLDSIKREIVG